jgi:hypothetical protein
MTEESFQQARKIMQRANYMRGVITACKGNVAKWSKIESVHRENMREPQANGAQKMLERAMQKLGEARAKFSELKFPDSDIVEEFNRCIDCGRKISKGNQHCGECLCEDDSTY